MPTRYFYYILQFWFIAKKNKMKQMSNTIVYIIKFCNHYDIIKTKNN